ncbi:MAG: TetR/AcrR family transcriptional regulator [Pseudomonadota bacterium]
MEKPKQRSNNRNEHLLNAAAELFSTQGFRGTTMRDIAMVSGMLPGSIYYHYGSKDELVVAVYEAGVALIVGSLENATRGIEDPTERLQAGLANHVEAITRNSHYMQVINRVLPEDVPGHEDVLRTLRAKYEACFRDLIEGLPLANGVNPTLLRLMILGAVNQTQFWFDPEGKMTPAEIGEAFARFLIEPITQVERETADA